MAKEEKKIEGTSPLKSRRDYGEHLKKVASYLTPIEVKALAEEAGIEIPEELKGEIIQPNPPVDYDQLEPQFIPIDEIPSTPPLVDYDDPAVSELVVLPPHGGPMPEEIPLEGPLPPVKGNLLCPGCSNLAPFGMGPSKRPIRKRRMRCPRCEEVVGFEDIRVAPGLATQTGPTFVCASDKVAKVAMMILSEVGIPEDWIKERDIKQKKNLRQKPTFFLAPDERAQKEMNTREFARHMDSIHFVMDAIEDAVDSRIIPPLKRRDAYSLVQDLGKYQQMLKSYREPIAPEEAKALRNKIVSQARDLGDQVLFAVNNLLAGEDVRPAVQSLSKRAAEDSPRVFAGKVASVLAYLLS